MISQQVSRALSGQPVFMRPSQGPSALSALQERVRGAEQLGLNATPGQMLLAQIMTDPTQAANLLNTMQYGGVSDRVGRVLGQRYAMLPGLMQRYAASAPEEDA